MNKYKEELQKEVEELRYKLEQLEKELKKKEMFEFKYIGKQTYLVTMDNVIHNITCGKGSFYKHGRYRKTKEAAEEALKLQTRMLRLHALVEQLDGFGGICSIWYDADTCKYKNTYEVSDNLGVVNVYMTEDCANKICDMLNSGEFTLDIPENYTNIKG